MKISSLQSARYEYSTETPGMLRHGIANIGVQEGEETQSAADQEVIKRYFQTHTAKVKLHLSRREHGGGEETSRRRYSFRRSGSGRTSLSSAVYMTH